jgi:hypothetical protein
MDAVIQVLEETPIGSFSALFLQEWIWREDQNFFSGKKEKLQQQHAGMKFCRNHVIFASAVNWSHVFKWRIWTERYGKHDQAFHNQAPTTWFRD